MASEIGVQTIQHTNGTDAMTIDSSGRVLTPARPALFAQGNSEANVTYANNADVAFATSGINKGEFEQGGMTLVSNTRFTAPVTGLYWFQAQVYKNENSTGRRFQIALNGSFNPSTTGAGLVHENTGAPRTMSIGLVLSLTANDYVTLKNGTGSDVVLYNGANHTFASMYLIG